ncbi:MAG: hypothetical protein ACTSW4_06415 [Candidatus Ranarchaeia archaeon]
MILSSSKRINQGLVAHICGAYLVGWEALTNATSLISILLEQLGSRLKIVHYFRKISQHIKPEDRPKIRGLWKALFDKNKESNPSILAALPEWLQFFDELDDEVYRWLTESVPHITSYWRIHQFLDFLCIVVDTAPKRTGALLWILLQDPHRIPDIPEAPLRALVKTLYEKGEQKLANRICNHMGEHGSLVLRPLYNEYNADLERHRASFTY